MRMNKAPALGFGLVAFLLMPALARSESYGIETLDLSTVEQGWGNPHADQSVEGHEFSIGGQKFAHGSGTHAVSTLRIALKGQGEQFVASVGVDDEVGKRGSVTFKVSGDGKTLWE